MLPIESIVLPKKGYTQEECEDSIQIHPSHCDSVINYKFAVADGATESSFSKEWANLLTSSIRTKKNITADYLLSCLPSLQKKWNELVFSRPLPYYAEIKAMQGAFSTLLTLQVNIKHCNYKCVAVGDCCLFQIRDSHIINCFPINESKDFGNNPFLISSNNSQNVGLKDYIKEFESDFIHGDQFFLLSDAIANWFLKEWEQNKKPWETVNSLFTDKILDKEIFNKWLNDQREAMLIKNDDTSIISILV